MCWNTRHNEQQNVTLLQTANRIMCIHFDNISKRATKIMCVPMTQIFIRLSGFTPYKAVCSLWPSDAIFWHISGLTLVQVRACYLTAPSHYINQLDLLSMSSVSFAQEQLPTKYSWYQFVNNSKNYCSISQWVKIGIGCTKQIEH